MASMSKLALWCVVLLMFTFTILVYISPSKPSFRSVLQTQPADDSSANGQTVQRVNKGTQHSQEPVHRHVSIAASSFELPPHAGAELPTKAPVNRSHEDGNDDDDEAAFLRAQSDIQRHRHRVMDGVCKKYHPDAEADVVKSPPWNIIVDDKYKMVYCFAQKVACTNWKKVFLVLSGQYNTTDSIPQFFTNRQGNKMLKMLEDYPEADRRRILRDYTKFMFARHPFSRVLSAYRNKLAPDSTFSRASKWQMRVGRKIINSIRSNGDGPSSKGFNKKTYDLSFEEFVKFILSPKGTKSGNKHWRDLHVSCLPCKMQYDIIGKIETIQDDARYILTLSGAAEAVSFPSAEGSSPTNSSDPSLIQKYFSNLPSQDIRDLYNRYIVDFLMFDYHATVDGVLDVR